MQNPNVLIAALRDHVGSTVTVRGWVAHLRSSGKVAFVVVRDGSGTMQAVVVRSVVPPESWETFGTLTINAKPESIPAGIEVDHEALAVDLGVLAPKPDVADQRDQLAVEVVNSCLPTAAVLR